MGDKWQLLSPRKEGKKHCPDLKKGGEGAEGFLAPRKYYLNGCENDKSNLALATQNKQAVPCPMWLRGRVSA